MYNRYRYSYNLMLWTTLRILYVSHNGGVLLIYSASYRINILIYCSFLTDFPHIFRGYIPGQFSVHFRPEKEHIKCRNLPLKIHEAAITLWIKNKSEYNIDPKLFTSVLRYYKFKEATLLSQFCSEAYYYCCSQLQCWQKIVTHR